MANPTPVPLSSTSTTTMPDYVTNYAQQLLSEQGAVSGTPYTTYQGPRVAPMTALQRQGAAMTSSAASAYQPYMAAATPALQRAGMTIPQAIGQYMNPYTDAVVGRIGQLGQRNLVENLLPAISDRFIGAGQFGGSRQAEAIGRSLRDVSESILAEQARALQSGYSEAAGFAGQDIDRAGALARMLTDMGGAAQTMGLKGAQAVSEAGAAERAVGQQNLDVAYADFLRQQGYPQEQIDKSLKTLQALKGVFPETKTATEEALPNAYKPSTLQNVASSLALLEGLFGDNRG